MMRISRLVVLLLVSAFLAAVCEAEDKLADPTARAERVTFTTSDGVTIVADYYGPSLKAGEKAPVAILLHMYPSDRTSWRSFAPKLVAKGIAVLAIDMRGHGESVEPAEMNLSKRRQKRDSRLYNAMDRDVAAAYEWLSKRDDLDLARLALVGASVGCSVAIDYARLDRSVDTVVCLSPGTNYMGVNSVKHIAKYGDRPILLMAGAEERSACEALGKLAARDTIKVYPMDGKSKFEMHGTNLLTQVDGAEKEVLEFIARTVGTKSAEAVVASVKSDVYHRPGTRFAGQIKPKNRRWFSSAEEAAQRGLRPPRSRQTTQPR
jgi:pimeloyl-ACP methyl ester carboxylesterase